MKKAITLTLASLLCVSMLAGCNSGSKMKDGTYNAEFTAADDHGWTEYVEITVSGEKITNVVFDGKNVDGLKKSEDASYEQAMKDAGSTTFPKDFYTKLAQQLVEKQDVEKVDAVAGATTSSNDFTTLVKGMKLSTGDSAVQKINR